MKCPFCETVGATFVVETTTDSSGNVRRRRECKVCSNRFSTFERSVLDVPQIVKAGGYREPFSREKVMEGLRIACVKRPVPAESLDQLVNHVEDTLRQMGQLEVPSQVVGDLVIEGLKHLDIIAYIRFAIVYLKLNNLESIRAEIDHLILERHS